MARLILHVGPGKCGSSSIQRFFNKTNNPCEESVRYRPLIPRVITRLNDENPNPELLDEFEDFLSQALEGCDVLILSHEWLFLNPLTLGNISRLATMRSAPVCIVGYSRRQSEFVVSAYSQWWFRSAERVNEVMEVFHDCRLDPDLFTGLERQLIASIANDFHSARHLTGRPSLDWSESYQRICENVDELSATVTCGVLPTRESGVSLIADFCQKSVLTPRPEILQKREEKVNISFNPNLVEAINNAVVLGMQMPEPHEHNDVIGRLSSAMPAASVKKTDFMNHLLSYTDTYYFARNQLLCKRFGLDEDYFAVAMPLSKQEAWDSILQEERHRSAYKSTAIRE